VRNNLAGERSAPQGPEVRDCECQFALPLLIIIETGFGNVLLSIISICKISQVT
jgi:hypothetical protein